MVEEKLDPLEQELRQSKATPFVALLLSTSTDQPIDNSFTDRNSAQFS